MIFDWKQKENTKAGKKTVFFPQDDGKQYKGCDKQGAAPSGAWSRGRGNTKNGEAWLLAIKQPRERVGKKAAKRHRPVFRCYTGQVKTAGGHQ